MHDFRQAYGLTHNKSSGLFVSTNDQWGSTELSAKSLRLEELLGQGINLQYPAKFVSIEIRAGVPKSWWVYMHSRGSKLMYCNWSAIEDTIQLYYQATAWSSSCQLYYQISSQKQCCLPKTRYAGQNNLRRKIKIYPFATLFSAQAVAKWLPPQK